MMRLTTARLPVPSFETAILSRMDVLLVLSRPVSNPSPSNVVYYHFEIVHD